MLVLDLFCGLGGFSKAFSDRGHRVIGIDLVPPASVCADLSRGVPIKAQPDVLLASPPCTEFTKESLPWRKTGKSPDMTLALAAFKAVQDLKPRWWCIENVQGAIKWFPKKPTTRVGSRILWTNIPAWLPPNSTAYGKWRLPPSPDRSRLRSMIPYSISLALCLACEQGLLEKS